MRTIMDLQLCLLAVVMLVSGSSIDRLTCKNGGLPNVDKRANMAICICPSSYSGRYCQIRDHVSGTSNGCPSGVTDEGCVQYKLDVLSGHSNDLLCNYTIKVLNEGAFFVRFSIVYKHNSIRQPIKTSKTSHFLGESSTLTIARNFEDLRVLLEVYDGASWIVVYEDKNLGLDTECTKCYKVWGPIWCPKWDYYFC